MVDTPVSPFAPDSLPQVPVARGVRMAVAEAGIKAKGRKDVLLMSFDQGTQVAGVTTRSQCPSAAVEWCREHLPKGTARGLLVNSGNANAFTGMKGQKAVERSIDSVCNGLDCAPHEVFVASTGVIGEPLDPSKFDDVMDGLVSDLQGAGSDGADAWKAAAHAIMTTDTFPKLATRTVDMGGVTITLNGISKGSGMIAPDMATMLSFIVTDAAIESDVLQSLIKDAVDASFNSITVDSDTSTSDTVLLFATGQADGASLIRDAGAARLKPFVEALNDLCLELAHWIVKDGEGASKFVEVQVTGATDNEAARKVADAIANSPLVKTAIAGEDANWGRIVMAVGKSGAPADRDKLSIWFGDIRVAVQGERDPDYSEDAASRVMKDDHITIRVDLGLGEGCATMWTCDFTHGYISINADYRS